MKVSLTVIAGPGVGTVKEFSEPRGFVIGRALDADFVLPDDDQYVSRRHVFLEICPPNCRVRDIGATNPPLLNNQPVQEADFKDGDILELGYTRFKVTVSGAQAPLPEVHCLKCNRVIDVAPDGEVPRLCGLCLSAQLAQSGRAHFGGTASCAFCDSDVSEKANNDGRASELEGIVAYSCEKCLPFDDKVRNTSIGDYVLVRKLGEGGMGVVYLAHHSKTGRLLALKQMKGIKDPEAVRRFERESRIMEPLVHQHIVRCLDTGAHTNGPFVVTEFVAGGDIESLVKAAGGKLSTPKAAEIIDQVLEGLGHLHEKQIVHRDIKPQNILIRMSEGKPDVVKLTDFGLAKCYGRAGGTRITKKNTGMGTLMYMPPEQIKDAAGVRDPADLYAVGVTLYYLLTGKYTFDFPTPREISEVQKQKPAEWKSPEDALAWIMRANRVLHPFRIILGEPPVPIRERDASIPKKLAAVVDKAIRKDPDERYRSAAEFRAALKGAL